MNIRHPWVTAFVILALMAGALSGCTSVDSEDSEGEMEIVTVERGSLATSITATGSILPGSEAILSSRSVVR